MRRFRSTACLLPMTLLAACGGRTPVPDLSGTLVSVIVAASLEGEPAAQLPLLLDSVSFSRIGTAARGAPLGATELHAQVGRLVELVDARDVLECPERRPCRLRGDVTYLSVWEAQQLEGGPLEVVVSRVYNVQDLYMLTRSVTHRLRLVPEAGGWRLVGRQRLPA
jgi:hypothetical protein